MPNPLRSISIALAAGSLFAAAAPAQAQCSAPGPDLSGVWQGNDGGTYRVSQVGNEVFWVGTSRDGGRSFINVYHGTRDGSDIHGAWADVGGRAHSGGTLALRVLNNGLLAVIQMSGGFSGNRWTRGGCSDVILQPSGE